MNMRSTTNDSELILIVDDDFTMRLLMRESLEQAGLNVIEASNGDEALEAFANQKPDLLLLDVKMPGMDGYEVCATIRQQDAGKEIPVIMITGLDDSESIEKAYGVGATDFITKPVVWTILSHRIRYLLRAAKAFQDLRSKEKRLVQAQRVAHLGNWDWDIIRDRVYWSQEVYRIFGLSQEADFFSFRECLEFIHPDDLQGVRKVIDASLDNNEPHKIEYKVVRKDGTEIIVEHQAEVGSNDQGIPIYMHGTIQDISERKQVENHIRQLAYYDHLTGLPNRQLFYETLNREMLSAKRENKKLALIFLDLDRFKEVNDTLGHDAGDELLKNIASYLSQSVRASDIVAHIEQEDEAMTSLSRLGGDEFTILIPDLDEVDEAAHVCRRVLDQLRLPMKLAGRYVTVTGSMGIAVYPDDGDNIDQLLRHSDMAMYHAKQDGKNNYKFFTDAMNERVEERINTESELIKGLERDEFVLQYEPRIDIESGRIVGLEALVRWQHPTRGLLQPGHFIEIAEESGLIQKIGEWVLKTACGALKDLLEKVSEPITMTVNLSADQLDQSDLVGSIERIVHQNDLDPSYLEIELTESMVVENFEAAISNFNALKQLGVRLSLDNFGMGHSSLAYLKQFPIDSIKLDKSFISELESNEKDMSIVKSMVILARGLNMVPVAEGVERYEQLDLLRELGCVQAQGYLISKGMTLDEVERLLLADR